MPKNKKHLYEAGWAPDREMPKDFEATREIDLRKTEENNLDDSLKYAHYETMDDRRKIMRSALDPSVKTADGRANWGVEEVKVGTRFYALTTVTEDGHGAKSAKSPYWLREAEIENLEREKLINTGDRKIEAIHIKNRYAIPCSNKVNGMVETTATKDHLAIRTTIGPGKDVYAVDNEERIRWMDGGGTQWHPDRNFLNLDRSRDVQKLAQRNGRLADYSAEGYTINYSAADRQAAPVRPAPSQQQEVEKQRRQEFGAKVETCHKAMGESLRARDYDPEARKEYPARKAEMDGHISIIAKDPTLLDEISDAQTRKSIQGHLSQWRRQNETSATSSPQSGIE